MLIPDYNPDVLTCLANLSSDEVFTPPKLANEILDLFPSELWSDETARFLDPGCKSGVFLREIAKRLDQGLEQKIPDRQERINHICRNQLFALAITELTALLARRSVYCSKKANGKYSVCDAFDGPEGNIQFIDSEHTWENGKCIFCGVSEKSYSDLEHGERHAYSFLHIKNPKDLFNMKFDVIIGNPPYQMSDGGAQASAIPIYHRFVQQAKKLSPRYLCMITPSRWFTGGKGLDGFREEMLDDRAIREMHDYWNASECFPGVEIKGGVSYFLWDRDYTGDCKVVTHAGGQIVSTATRALRTSKCEHFVRYNDAIPILDKIQLQSTEYFDSLVSARKPFGIPTNFNSYRKSWAEGYVKIFGNKTIGFIERSKIPINREWVDQPKLFVPYAWGSGNSHTDVIKPLVGEPESCCTETYLVLGPFASMDILKNVQSYMATKFFHFLVTLLKNTQHATSAVYELVPIVDFTQSWCDEDLYQKYSLTKAEIKFIETLVHPAKSQIQK